MGFFDRLRFDNHFATLGPEFFTRLLPTPLPDPYFVAASPAAAALPDLDPAAHRAFLRAVVERTARLMAHWQTIGFAHGAMNTDDMSILGIAFDVGPFGFMGAFDPDFISNHGDDGGRYAFANQPSIAYSNPHCLAQALTPLLSVDECRDALSAFEPAYREKYAELFRAKLGLVDAADGDAQLIAHLLEILQGNAVDYTLFFRALCDYADAGDDESVGELFQYPEAYVPRGWLLERAIERAQAKDFSEIDKLLGIFRRPFEDQEGSGGYDEPAAASLPVDAASCSS